MVDHDDSQKGELEEGGGIGSGGGSLFGGAGCSGVLGAVINNSLELNMVTGVASDINCDC